MSIEEPSTAEKFEHARQRLHIVGPILHALDHSPQVIQLLHEAADAEDGRRALEAEFGFDEIQAMAVMDAQFHRVTRRDRDELRTQLDELQALIAELEGALRNGP